MDHSGDPQPLVGGAGVGLGGAGVGLGGDGGEGGDGGDGVPVS